MITITRPDGTVLQLSALGVCIVAYVVCMGISDILSTVKGK